MREKRKERERETEGKKQAESQGERDYLTSYNLHILYNQRHSKT